MQGIALFLHLSAVIVWLGGMFFSVYCLRPAIADLQPQQRAPLMVDSLGRFFKIVFVAIVLIWVSGLSMMIPIGMEFVPIGWHVMMGLGALMSIIFFVLWLLMYPKAKNAVARSDLPAAGRILERMRVLIMTNLWLGFIAVAAVSLAT